jgi:predicted nucleic acid-binding protein
LNLVVDASVAVKWLVAESGHEYAAALLHNLPALRAPDFIAI